MIATGTYNYAVGEMSALATRKKKRAARKAFNELSSTPHLRVFPGCQHPHPLRIARRFVGGYASWRMTYSKARARSPMKY